jgi:hypothetical protein
VDLDRPFDGPAARDQQERVDAVRPTNDVDIALHIETTPGIPNAQALKRTANYTVEIISGEVITVSVPRPFGALILKAAAYQADTRDRDRHLQDAAVLLACVDDPIAERDQLHGSDRSRLLTLERELVDTHSAWLLMPDADARRGQAVLRALCGDD